MALNPEQLFLREHTLREAELSDQEQKVDLDFAQPYKKDGPKIDDFDGLYSDIERQRDKNKIQELKQSSSETEKTERAEDNSGSLTCPVSLIFSLFGAPFSLSLLIIFSVFSAFFDSFVSSILAVVLSVCFVCKKVV